jgi:hypothetical protein
MPNLVIVSQKGSPHLREKVPVAVCLSFASTLYYHFMLSLYFITLCCKRKTNFILSLNVIIENCRKSRMVFMHAGHTRAKLSLATISHMHIGFV